MNKSIFYFNREKTAINSKRPSILTRLAYESGLIKETVLDWGSGKGRDSKWLASKKLETIQYDIFYNPLPLISDIDFNKIKTILLNYVLNVIEDKEERFELLKEIKKRAVNDTLVLIMVRSEREISYLACKSKWKRYKDGYITGRNTFQKGFNLKEVNNLSSFLGSNFKVKQMRNYVSSIIIV